MNTPANQFNMSNAIFQMNENRCETKYISNKPARKKIQKRENAFFEY